MSRNHQLLARRRRRSRYRRVHWMRVRVPVLPLGVAYHTSRGTYARTGDQVTLTLQIAIDTRP